MRIPAGPLNRADADQNEAILARGSVAYLLARHIRADFTCLRAVCTAFADQRDLNYWTVIVACMKGWMVQKYANVPGVLNDLWYDSPMPKLPLSNSLVSEPGTPEVTVWGAESWLAQVIVVPTATVMSESANPTILDASTAGGRGVGVAVGVGAGSGVAVDAGEGVAVGSIGAGVGTGPGGGPAEAGVGVGSDTAVDVAAGPGGGAGAGVGVAVLEGSGVGAIVGCATDVGATTGSGMESSSDVAVAGASPAAWPGVALEPSVSEEVTIAVAAAARTGGLVGTDAAGVEGVTSSDRLGPEPESELHAAAVRACKDNAVKNSTRPDRILRRIDTSIIVTRTPRSLPLPYSTATTYGPNPLCDLSFVVK